MKEPNKTEGFCKHGFPRYLGFPTYLENCTRCHQPLKEIKLPKPLDMQFLDVKVEAKIPCDCPKGGMDVDGRLCTKCNGTEWVSTPSKKQETFEAKAAGDKIHIPQSPQNRKKDVAFIRQIRPKMPADFKEQWEERFDRMGPFYVYTHTEGGYHVPYSDQIKSFIKSLLEEEWNEGWKAATERFEGIDYNDLIKAKEEGIQEEREKVQKVMEEIAYEQMDLCENSLTFKKLVLSKLNALLQSPTKET